MKKFYGPLLISIVISLAVIGCSKEPGSFGEENVIIGEQEFSPGITTSNQEEGLVFEDALMGFRVKLPMILEGKVSEEISTTENNGEVITTANIYYEGETDKVQVLSFDEMSEKLWKQMQEEGGPLGKELGISDDGRVIVMNTLQSNPFEEGTTDFEVFNQFPKQLKVVEESFEFISK